MKRLLVGLLILCLLPVTAWAASPYFIDVPQSVSPGRSFLFTFFAAENALCDLVVIDGSGQMAAAITQEYEAMFGANSIAWDGTYWGEDVDPGEYTLSLTVNGETVTAPLTVTQREMEAVPLVQTIEEEPEEILQPEGHYPAMDSPYVCDHENCYWRTPMDISDEEAVWNMLMAPMTVIDGEQKDQIFLRAEPSEDSQAIAEITCYSQGVHVLEHLDNGWSLIECYSSSFIYSEIKAWNEFTQGYVPTELLKERQVGNTEFGMVVDKLTQRLYIFQDGQIIADLLCSTGLGTEEDPYNETRSGEFFLVSPVGEFPSGKLSCSYGIRFNDGDILHEVPHIKRGDTKVYETTEPKLGNRASHGCIRVQRLKNQDGINMNWIWNKLYKSVAKKNVKLVIWEDYQGRQLEYPEDDLLLYYNDDGGKNYHRGENCYGVRAKFLPLSIFTYGQFDEEPYASLTQCPYCSPVLKVEQIDAINAAHAE
ncbi:MAG: L,D-transpeptidase family protein [Clostridia bacterium]|nr:L,D-transpeptidase family protein [Clostridia bacterium]